MTEPSSGKRREFWIIAGEASGDLYGAGIASELRQLDPELHLAGMGGVRMKEADVELIADSTELGVIGLVEVLGCLFKFIAVFLRLLNEARKRHPEGVILIDYPGFNLRMAKWLKKLGIPVIWYISPQVWAWRKGNIKRLAARCRKMLVIFPFEPEVYAGSGLDVEFVGHPLVDIVNSRKDPSLQREKDLILLLPGSRKKEIAYLWEPFLQTVVLLKRRHPELRFAVSAPRPAIESMIREGIEKFRKEHPELPEIEVSCGRTPEYQQRCIAGLAASGTVTVECAIAGLPLVVAYRLNKITFLLARIIIGKLFRGFFTMVNIILNKNTFHEFLQFQVVPEVLASEMEKILPGGERREEVLEDMKNMTAALTPGADKALRRTAVRALETIGK